MKDMVRDSSPAAVNKRIDEETLEHLERYRSASRDEIEQRLKDLETSWDLECYVELFGSLTSLAGLALAAKLGKKWLLVPAISQGLVLAHSLPVWDPLTPLFRLLGAWSRPEIEREKQALKLLRGDYERVSEDDSAKSALATAQGRAGIKQATGARKSRRKKSPAAKTIESGPEMSIEDTDLN